jgi:hypothetical protein
VFLNDFLSMFFIRAFDRSHWHREVHVNPTNFLLTTWKTWSFLGTSINEIKSSAEKLFKASQNIGLIINDSKTKYMLMSGQVSPKNDLKV